MCSNQIKITKIIPEKVNNTRLDLALSKILLDYSRSQIQSWIKEQKIKVDNKFIRQKDKVFTNQIIEIATSTPITKTFEPQPIKLNIIYEDNDIIIINKSAGLVVHPGAGNKNNTLLNALIYRYPELVKLPRAGIIHRLDKNTSGILVITRNSKSNRQLTYDLQKRKIKREYEAIVQGNVLTGGTIEAPIGRHSTKRTMMAIKIRGKYAITHYSVIKKYSSYTHLRLSLETGRTHQIRVHLSHIGYPIVGDPTYNKNTKLYNHFNNNCAEKIKSFHRQALHAKRLELRHPDTNKIMEWIAPIPNDMIKLLDILRCQRYVSGQ